MPNQLHKRLPLSFVEEVLTRFNEKKIGEERASDLLDITRASLYRIRKKWLSSRMKRKPFGLWHRDRSSFHTLGTKVHEWLHKELRYIKHEADTYRNNFNFAFLAEQAHKRFHRRFSRNGLRQFALRHGYYHRLPEEKRKVFIRFETSGPGALYQHDSSPHAWLPLLKGKQNVILTKDDYSRMIVGATIVARESSFAHLETVRQSIEAYGVPEAYYVDNHSIFRFIERTSVHVKCTAKEADGHIQFKRALTELGIGIVYTGKRCPEAKGKIEKAFDYFQRRLPQLAERYKVKTIKDAQKILNELVDYYNTKRIHDETKEIPYDRFKQAVKDKKTKLTPLPSNRNLERIFSLHFERVVKKDGTISFMGKPWKIGSMPSRRVIVCLIPNYKFMVYYDATKLAEFKL